MNCWRRNSFCKVRSSKGESKDSSKGESRGVWMSGNWRLLGLSRGVLVSWRWLLPSKERSSGESLEPAEGEVRRRVRISVLKIENQQNVSFSFGLN